MPMREPLPVRRIQIVGENREIAESAQYTAPSGKSVTLPQNGDALAAATQLLDIELPEDAVPCRASFSWEANQRAVGTVECAAQLRAEGVKGEILALNFANANVAGGGYVLGASAQEESLCRASLLYAAIAPHSEYYNYHRTHPTPFYSDKMLYSPNVPVVRDGMGNLLEEPFLCSFLTSPAVNRRLARPIWSNKKIDAAMAQRTAKIIVAAAKIVPEAVILGAYGCGVFGNRREVVLPMFEDAICKYLPEGVKVFFAMP